MSSREPAPTIPPTLLPTDIGAAGAHGRTHGDAEITVGSTIGEYVVRGKLGEGGFGVVYAAAHPVIGKEVAIKILNHTFSVDPAMVSRFVAEARAVNQIRHRNIIDIFSFGALADGRHYYVMELLEGTSLDGFLEQRGGHLPAEIALPILRAVARALDAAHAKGIAHRDLKPANVYIAEDDGAPFPKLLDFGIAKLLGSDAAQHHKTQTGAPIGTPTYMSPEQCRGKNVDHRTDIYSFGIMTYEVLTGLVPFSSDDFVELLMQQTTAAPTPPSQACPDVPAALDEPILRMLAKAPADRPATVTAAVDAMYAAIGMPYARQAMTPPMGIPIVSPRATGGSVRPAPAPSIPSLVAAEAIATPPRKRGKLAAGVVTGLFALAAGGALFALTMRGGSSAAPAELPSVAPAPVASSSPVVAPPPVAPPVAPPPVPAAPAPAQEVVARAPASVEITIEGAPPGTDVYGADRTLLGTLPNKLTVPRSAAPLAVTLEHDGFVPRTEKIAVTASVTLSLPLKAKPIAKRPAVTKPAKPAETKPAETAPAVTKPSSELPDFDDQVNR